jgi:hypothetical protein
MSGRAVFGLDFSAVVAAVVALVIDFSQHLCERQSTVPRLRMDAGNTLSYTTAARDRGTPRFSTTIIGTSAECRMDLLIIS